jgi:hypothetical protein
MLDFHHGLLGMDGPKPEARWQVLNASLNAIKRVVRR